MAHKVNLLRLATTTPHKYINVYVTHRIGEGYFLHVDPVTIEDGMMSYTLFSGTSAEIERGARFNSRRMDTICDEALAIVKPLSTETVFKQLLDVVLAKHALTVAPGQTEMGAALAACPA